MLTLEKKYFIQKFLLGVLFILTGWVDVRDFWDTPWKWGVVAVLVLFLIVYVWSLAAKSEPDDEYAKENRTRAKAHMYDLILLLMLVNTLFGKVDALQITRGHVFAVFGILQIAEFVHFVMLEKRLES
jgi:phosphatidylglycerophosphate synthase